MKNALIIFIILFIAFPAHGAGLLDSDKDAVPDKDEINVYFTDPFNKDTDGDGYSDWEELNSGYSPHNPKPVRLQYNDQDNDGLTDRMELNFKTNMVDPDTDGDGYLDGEEVDNGYDPLNPDPVKLPKRIEVDLNTQTMYYFLNGVKLGSFLVSSGKPSSYTPKGDYMVDDKHLRAYSHQWGLWMPYWMSIDNGYIGIHELPEWPDGTKEGENHLGTPVSHGCIRLGVGPAEFMYNWAPIGTPVYVY